MEEKKKTNGWSIAGFASSFFTTIIAFILCIVALKKAKKYEWDGKALSIIGLVLSSIKLVFLIIITIICLIAYKFYTEYNIKDCLTATDCVENEDGTYTCKKNGESLKCLYSTGEVAKDITNDILDDAIGDIDLNLDIDDPIEKYFTSDYEEYNEAVDYLYTNSDNLTFIYTYGYSDDTEAQTRELNAIELLTVLGLLKTQMPNGELPDNIGFEMPISITTSYKDNGDTINFSIIKNSNTYYVIVANQTKEEYHGYTFGESATSIFDILN